MKILLYGINYSPELTGTGKYTGEMGAWFAAQGHEVRAITAPPYYPEWKIKPGYSAWRYDTRREDGVRVTRCPLYVPPRPRVATRLLHLISFSLTSTLPMLAQWRWKSDLIICVAPTLFCAPQAKLLAMLTGAHSVLHIQDYEVDALFGLGMARGGFLKRIIQATERRVLRWFDTVSTISSGMLERARQKGVPNARLCFFPNWSEVERFQGAQRSPALLQKLGIDPAKKVILYAGNIGEKQGLEIAIEVAERLQANTDYVFLIVGEGAGKAKLTELAKRKNLNNVKFGPLQAYDDLPSLLASADCHLVIQKRGAADAVLPSKLTNILAVGGNAVITADADTSLGQLCEEYPGIAVRVEPESMDKLVEGINSVMGMQVPNPVATRYAQERLDKDRILQQFLREAAPLDSTRQTAH